MLICSNCNNEQESGKFCGVCGGALQAAQSQPGNPPVQPTPVNTPEGQVAATTTTTAEPQTQQTTEKIKNVLSQYWAYFLNVIKNPTSAFQLNESHFINGIITMVLYILTFSLSIYFIANSLMRATFGGLYDQSLPFFLINSRLVFLAILAIALTFGSAMAMTKIAKSRDAFKTILAQYGGLIVPFTALNVIAILGGLVGSPFLTFIPLTISFTVIFSFVPVLFVFEKASTIDMQGQKIYLSLATLFLIAIGTYIIGEIAVFNLIDDLDSFFYNH